MNYQFTSIDTIFAKVERDLTPNFKETDIIEWVGEALAFIGASRYYEEAVAFAEVKNFTCNIPTGSHSIIQLARNNNWTPEIPTCVTPAGIIAETPNVFFQDCSNCGGVQDIDNGYVVLDGKGTPVLEYDIAYYRPYFDLIGEYYGWSNSNYFKQSYSPIRLKTNNFFGSLVCQLRDNSCYKNSKDEYSVINRGTTLKFSFECGSVAIAYNKQVLDRENGYPMIPDHVSYTTAILAYIGLRMSKKDFFNHRDGAKGVKDDYEADWQWYSKQAGNVEMMPNGIDEHQNLLDQRQYILPRLNEYYSFFGNLAQSENRKYDDPDYRNRGNRFFLRT